MMTALPPPTPAQRAACAFRPTMRSPRVAQDAHDVARWLTNALGELTGKRVAFVIYVDGAGALHVEGDTARDVLAKLQGNGAGAPK